MHSIIIAIINVIINTIILLLISWNYVSLVLSKQYSWLLDGQQVSTAAVYRISPYTYTINTTVNLKVYASLVHEGKNYSATATESITVSSITKPFKVLMGHQCVYGSLRCFVEVHCASTRRRRWRHADIGPSRQNYRSFFFLSPSDSLTRLLCRHWTRLGHQIQTWKCHLSVTNGHALIWQLSTFWQFLMTIRQ